MEDCETKFDCFMNCKRSMCDVWDDCLCASHAKCKIVWGCAEHRISAQREEVVNKGYYYSEDGQPIECLMCNRPPCQNCN